MSAPSHKHVTGFEWDAERRFPLILAGLVALSFLAHAAAFFLFQVTYPQRVTIPPLAPQVTVLSPDQPEHQPLLAWIAAEDPALSAATARASVPGIQQIPYQPSYAMVRTWPRPAPLQGEPVPLPSGRSGLEILEAAGAISPSAEPSLAPVKTTITVSEALAGRTLNGSFDVKALASAALQPAQFLLGVSDVGQVRYTFLRQSSGDRTVDEAASRALQKLNFAPAPLHITWGFVTISWGDDIYSPPGTAGAPK